MSEQVERKLLGLLAAPYESPYGNPIPGLDELGGEATTARPVRPLPEALADGRADPADPADSADSADPAAKGDGTAFPLMVRRLGEPLQGDHELLAALFEVDCRPGRRVAAQFSGSSIRVRTASGEVDLTPADAQYVFVETTS